MPHGATGACWAFVGCIKEKKLRVVFLTSAYEDVDDLGVHILDPSFSLRTIEQSRP